MEMTMHDVYAIVGEMLVENAALRKTVFNLEQELKLSKVVKEAPSES